MSSSATKAQLTPTDATSLFESSQHALNTFLSSKARFGIVQSLRIPSSAAGTSPEGPSPDEGHQQHVDPPENVPAGAALAILDSSYNPPQRAHLKLVRDCVVEGWVGRAGSSPLHSSSSPRDSTGAPSASSLPSHHGAHPFAPPPSRIILLFSTANADKAAGAHAGPAERIAMLRCFAADLADELGSVYASLFASSSVSSSNSAEKRSHIPAIDVALTTEPLYTAKSEAISSPRAADAALESLPTYPASVAPTLMHTHIVGHDTFARILSAKYYASKGYDPPLSALDTFFEQHGLRVVLRPEEGDNPTTRSATSSAKDGDAASTDAVEAQLSLYKALASGALASQGGQQRWAARIAVVGAAGATSSTAVRASVRRRDWDALGEMCSSRVAGYVRARELYLSDE